MTTTMGTRRPPEAENAQNLRLDFSQDARSLGLRAVSPPAPATLPAVVSRRRVDGSIVAPMSGSRARAASRRAPVTPRALRRPASR